MASGEIKQIEIRKGVCTLKVYYREMDGRDEEGTEVEEDSCKRKKKCEKKKKKLKRVLVKGYPKKKKKKNE